MSKHKKSEETMAADETPVSNRSGGAAVPDPLDRFGLGELAHWPAWLGRRWPERFFGEFDAVGMGGIKVEEFMDDEHLVIRAEVPGIDPDDIEVSVDNGRLSIRAERQSHTESKDGFQSEFRYGSFARVISMPEGAKADDIEASCTDGILEIKVPVDADATKHGTKIPIKRD